MFRNLHLKVSTWIIIVCVCVCLCVLASAGMCPGHRYTLQCLPHCFSICFLRQVSSLTCNFLFRQRRLARKSGFHLFQCSPLSLPTIEVPNVYCHTQMLWGASNLDLCSRACTASTLPTEPCHWIQPRRF